MTDQSPQSDTPDDFMERADFLTGAVLFVLGLVIIYFSWTMPRLEMRSVHPATVPGLVPGLLGILLTLCGLMLGVRAFSRIRGIGKWSGFFAAFRSMEMVRFGAIAGLSLVFTLVLVGLVPFWLATGLFVFAAIVTFEALLNDTPKPLAKSILWAAVQAIIVAAVVTAVFEQGFLVRLP